MRKRNFPRSRGDVRPQTPSNACRAALTARSMSADLASATSASVSSVAGLIDAKYVPDFGLTHFPPMNRS